MAFLRKEKKNSVTYLRIVQSYRDEDGKARHRTLYNLGKAEDYTPEALKKIGKALYELGGGTLEELESKMLHELGRFNYGFPLIVKQLMNVFALDRFLNGITRNKDLGFSMAQSIALLISERFNDPVSKLSNYKNQLDYIGIAEIELHQIYRTLDYLFDNQEKIKMLIYSKGRNLFNQKLDLVFYDVTTFYFESSKEDGFREKGFGKDGKIGNTIITFGMLIDKNKQPVGYEVYRGRQYEGHTFSEALARLKTKYQIDRVICVADTGMMNEDNVEEVKQADYEYIFGERLKNISRSKQNEIIDLKKYKVLGVIDQKTGLSIPIKYYTTEYNDKRLIATYSEKRARKDKAERDEKIAKAIAFINNPEPLNKKAKYHYLKKEGKDAYSLDTEKIKRSEMFDGFFCIATNNTDLSEEIILDAYKQLYKIEHTFRTFKSFLETRPMFHWTERRILGHLSLCYISFALLNHLQLKLQNAGTPQTEATIRENLVRMQLSLVTQNNHEYYLRSKTTPGGKEILKALSINTLPDLVPKQSITKYLPLIE
ncbi:MAG: IS1634 family transposase [Bacteroidetes bacterium]|nr:IS1634 family transposase [Bacteroidota bacterium]MBU1720269.1 IS1634 family transposase [Bacteroidota bacterium]